MTQAAKAQEPSMEEILASIRRIIADDEAKPVAGAAAPPAKPEPAPAPPKAAAPQPARAAPPPPPPPASNASNSQDDIDAMLASLDVETSEAEVRAPQPEPEPEADVFELTEQMAVPSPAPKHVEPVDDLEFSEPPPPAREPARQRAYEPPPAPAQHEPEPAPMLSNTTVFAVESAFNSLAHTVLSNNARTLEDLVKEMLRPMLKSWLDDNLPGLVERIVKAEIERVSRGGR